MSLKLSVASMLLNVVLEVDSGGFAMLPRALRELQQQHEFHLK
jgi:hypothetical protein